MQPNLLLRLYQHTLLGSKGKEHGWWSNTLRGVLNSRCKESVQALEYHAKNFPSKDGTGFLGYLDTVQAFNNDHVELRGWLVHIESRIVALTFFTAAGAVMADYGFPRPDLVELLPHLPQVDLSGFRVVMRKLDLPQQARLTFQAFLTDQATRFGSFEIDRSW